MFANWICVQKISQMSERFI